jgi:dTDP-4-dehydrorhamnose reductase
MRVVVTGMNGQVGRELRAADWPQSIQLIALDRAGLDVGDPDAVAEVTAATHPDVVINAAAYTAVDRAEEEPEAAYRANRDGPAALAAACADQGAALVHLSTDYVFDGSGTRPWHVDDPVRPLGVYGRSKAAGEEAVRETLDRHVIVRTAWVHAPHGHNFVRTILRVGAERADLKVVGDQRGCPTAAGDIAAALVTIAGRIADGQGRFGTYHFCGQPAVSWHAFAETIFTLAEPFTARRPRVACITSADWPTPVTRPANSVLDCSTLKADYGIWQPDWRVSLKPVVARLLAADYGGGRGD